MTLDIDVTNRFKVTLKRIRRLSETTLDFRFNRDDGKPVEFLPGQFFRFNFEDDAGKFERSYSLCNFGEDNSNTSSLDLVVSQVRGGRASKILFDCKVGMTASASGPFGRLLVPRPLPSRLFMVATSVGIAPFMPMLSLLSSALDNLDVEVFLLFGVRTQEEFLYREEILAVNSRYDNFALSMCYSQKSPDDPQSFDHQGHVTDRLRQMSLVAGTDHILLCGNPMMIDDCFSLLKALGFKARQVVREKYVFAKDKKPMQKRSLTEEQKRLIREKAKKYL